MPIPTKTDRYVETYYDAIGGAHGLASLEQAYSRPKKIVPVVERLIGTKKNKRVLDLCCGYGRIAIPLAAHGYDVEGIDIREEMIRRGRALAKRAGVSVRFLQG